MRLFTLLLLSLFLSACIETPEELPNEAIGLAPIYAAEDWEDIGIEGPRDILNLGKLYYKSPFIYATDRGRGIHVIDNTNPDTPEKIAFIRIPGNSDLAIKNNIMYANNVADLIAINIGNLDSIFVIERLEGAFKIAGVNFPEGYVGYFECVDENLGTVVGWYETSLDHPQCWR